jgi:uroporphyrinogen decarboxylase
MHPLSGKERIGNILKRQPVDRIGVFEHFWQDTQRNWEQAGYLLPGESLETRFGLDMQLFWPFDFTADLDYEPEVVEEDTVTILMRDGNGALLRRHKLHETTPEHVDFLVQNRQTWEEHAKPYLKAEARRINFEGYRQAKLEAAENERFFCWSGVNVFELMHPVCGHEHMLVGMAMDPDWIKEMVSVYATIIIEMWELLFAQGGYPDGIWFYEDMGFKNHPFMSPKMYKEIIQPAHIRTIEWAHSRNLPVIMHSCGYIAPLVPYMIEAGIDCLQVIEVKAGMDLLDLYQKFGHVLSFMGGIDVRVLYTNDRAVIDRELEAKIPTVKGNNGFVLHSDHSIPSDVDPENYAYFIKRGLELGAY